MDNALEIQKLAHHEIEAMFKVRVNQGVKNDIEVMGSQWNGCRRPFRSSI